MRRRMAQHPKSVTMGEAMSVLEAYGWVLTRISGSHHRFSRGGVHLTVPLKRPTILPVYVRQILVATSGENEQEGGSDHDD